MSGDPVAPTIDHLQQVGGADIGFPGGCGRPAESTTTTTPLLLNPTYSRTKSMVCDELRNLRISLKWCALDHSSTACKAVSYTAFAVLALAVPAATAFAVRMPPQPPSTVGSVNRLVQLPESALAAISFFTLCSFFQRYGLRQLLFLDGLRDDSAHVRRCYARELDRAFKYLTGILLPSFSVELVHKIVFFSRVSVRVPHHLSSRHVPWSSLALVATLASWVYRTGVFLLVCVLFRLTCELQILRLEGFRRVLEGGCGCCGAGDMFREHARIRKQLLVTSHRYRIFIICCFVTITITQLGALMLVLSYKAERDFCNSGDLLVCSVVQLSGFFMCLLGAARITHRAQGVVAIAARWHMIMTCASSSSEPTATPAKSQVLPLLSPPPLSLQPPPGDVTHASNWPSTDPKTSSDSPWSAPPDSYVAVETRKALVKYLQHNSGGITLFGFALDRGLLHTLFAFEMSLVLWILSKGVALS